jgi:hypothetical protein
MLAALRSCFGVAFIMVVGVWLAPKGCQAWGNAGTGIDYLTLAINVLYVRNVRSPLVEPAGLVSPDFERA